MKGLKQLGFCCLLLVTLLALVNSINAKKKEPYKKEVENKKYNQEINSQNEKYEKKNKYETSKEERLKKSTGTYQEDSKVETKKYKVKKGTKDGQTVRLLEKEVPKVTKTHQKLKKYKLVEDDTVQNIASGKLKSKKTKQKVEKQETMDEVYKKSVIKTSQKKVSQKDKTQRIVEDSLNMVDNGGKIIDKDENSASNLKKKKYKLVEVILEEGAEEDNEGNETVIEIISDDVELANTQRTDQEEEEIESLKSPKQKKVTKVFLEEDSNEDITISEEFSESEFNEDSSGVESFSSKYGNPEPLEVCQPLPQDSERQGPKKLTLYVIEEEVNGNIKKKVVSEEDGVTMCEVSDLLREHYYAGLP